MGNHRRLAVEQITVGRLNDRDVSRVSAVLHERQPTTRNTKHRFAIPHFGRSTIDVLAITKPKISQVHAIDLRKTET